MPGNHSSGVLLNGFTCILIVSGISKSERETGRKEGRGGEARRGERGGRRLCIRKLSGRGV